MVPKRALPEHSKSDILEIKVARCAEPEKELTLYGKHSPGYKSARLDLNQIGVAYGEELWVRSVGRYLRQKFAVEYNLIKPIGLKNTELILDGRPCLKVDGTEVGLTVRGFRTFESKAILDVEFGIGQRLGIVRGQDGFSVKMRDHSRVLSIQSAGNQVVLTYQMPPNPVHTRICPVAKASSSCATLPRNEHEPHLRVWSRPGEFEGTYEFKMSTGYRIPLIARLANLRVGAYRKVRGDIGEEILDLALSRVDCPCLRDHPQDPGGREYDSSRKGPDTLRRLPNMLTAYFEGKWWGNLSAAISDAVEQADGFTRGDVYSGEQVGGAYIAILDWKMCEENCSVIVKRVW